MVARSFDNDSEQQISSNRTFEFLRPGSEEVESRENNGIVGRFSDHGNNVVRRIHVLDARLRAGRTVSRENQNASIIV